MLSDHELLQLAAKDRVVRTHRNDILKWSVHTWEAAIRGVLRNFPQDAIKTLRERYPDA